MIRYCKTSVYLPNRRRIDAGLRADLSLALLRREFFVVYQPIVDVSSNRVVMHEALIRWRHPVRGVVMPREFIDVAEGSEIICGITDSVLDQVFTMLSVRQGLPFEAPVSINISPVCLVHGCIVDIIRKKMEIYGVDANSVFLEITEAAPVDASDHILNQFSELQAMGVRIFMDDFGVGFSEVANLLRLPFNGIKIDSSLLRQVPNDNRCCVLISGVIEIALKLGLTVVAEGIESHQQLEWIRRYPGVLAQGWLFGLPLEL
ncbi:EAL domain-containing protein [Burkholderia ubonensis]|uniref:EAL domain-containing protein n=1 Tax=Burkholderia ubonensis TaxID=101571 RepID=UPI0009B3C620|nr:EAL domain-containing protein [Burkholderia ubonensis]